MGTFLTVENEPPARPRTSEPAAVLAVASNKGGVGKTTLATNLAIYIRALREDLPVALVGLDDQRGIDRMFALGPPAPGERNLKNGWAERSLDGVLQLGEYGVHFVPSPTNLSLLKARADNPTVLRRILAGTDWSGLVILDTKSDLEALTLNAFHAADRILLPVADWASLEEAARSFAILERGGLGAARARVVMTLVDRRTRVDRAEPLVDRLRREIRSRGWPCYETSISRSPRVEMLNSGRRKPLSILHHGAGTLVHGELRDLAEEILSDLAPQRAHPRPSEEPAELWGPRRVDLSPSRPVVRSRPAGWISALRRP
jgi:cellulose biosynthesis protein BcsQ